MENKYKIEFASATTKQQFFNMFTKSKEGQALLKKKRGLHAQRAVHPGYADGQED